MTGPTDPDPRAATGADESEATEDTGSHDNGQPARRTVPAGAFVLAVMAAMALGVLAIVALASGTGADDGDREIRLAAGRFAERFLTFEHGELDAWKAEVLDLSTAGFADEVDDAESGLRRLVADSELDASTEVTEVLVGQVDREAVDVIVVYDREVRASSGDRRETDRYMQLSMLRIEGRWLVENVTDFPPAGGAGLTPRDPGDGSGGPEETDDG